MQPLQQLPTEQSTAGDLARQLAVIVGPAYQPADGTLTAADLLALGGALAGARSTNQSALNEAFADTTTALLSELEAEYGLQVRPDLTTAQRQDRLVAKIRATFSGTPQDILTAVRTLAPEATITEVAASVAIASGNHRNVFKFIVTISLAHIQDVNVVGQLRAILEQMKPAQTSYSIVTGRPFYLDISPLDFTAF